jgi:hypothetical protein
VGRQFIWTHRKNCHKGKKKKKNTLANVIPLNSKNKCYTSRRIENFTYLTRKNIIKELGSILKQAAIFFLWP